MSNAKDIHTNYDNVFKEALMLYKNKTLDFLGLDLAMIDNPINTEITEINITKRFSDMCFMLKDGTGLHMEWEANISSDDIMRFCFYNINYRMMYKTKFTTVIFTNKPQSISDINDEILKFSPTIINLGIRDGDALLDKIKTQVENNIPVNSLELIYLPLCYSKYKNIAEMLTQVIEIASVAASSKEDREKIMTLSAVLVNKFIGEADWKKIWEAIKMYVDDLFIVKFARQDAEKEGIEKGRVEGIEKGRVEGIEKGRVEGKIELILNLIRNGIAIETIAKSAELPIDEVIKIKESM